jgi:hypothetical protein
MLGLADITLLAAVLIVAAVYHVFFTARWLRHHSAEAKKYRLFAVRDALVRLVAEGKISEDSPAFRKLYEGANVLVNKTGALTLPTFLIALKRARERGLDPTDIEIQQEIDRNSDLLRVVEMFYGAILSLLLENSLALRVLIKCKRFLPNRKGGHKHLPPTQRQAYEFYRDYSSRVSTAA